MTDAPAHVIFLFEMEHRYLRLETPSKQNLNETQNMGEEVQEGEPNVNTNQVEMGVTSVDWISHASQLRE